MASIVKVIAMLPATEINGKYVLLSNNCILASEKIISSVFACSHHYGVIHHTHPFLFVLRSLMSAYTMTKNCVLVNFKYTKNGLTDCRTYVALIMKKTHNDALWFMKI